MCNFGRAGFNHRCRLVPHAVTKPGNTRGTTAAGARSRRNTARRLHRLDHLGDLAVEQVVRLARRRQELLGDGGVEFNRGFDDGVAQRFGESSKSRRWWFSNVA